MPLVNTDRASREGEGENNMHLSGTTELQGVTGRIKDLKKALDWNVNVHIFFLGTAEGKPRINLKYIVSSLALLAESIEKARCRGHGV